MSTIDFKRGPYSLSHEEKDRLLTESLLELTLYHGERCPEYGRMLKALRFDPDIVKSPATIPFLPVSLFKKLRLSSLDASELFKSVTSSGTSGQARSQVVLDGETRTLQQMALTRIGGDFLGSRRLPMLIIDSEATVRKRDHFSARTAGVLGFSLFGSRRVFALNEDMTLNREIVKSFLNQYGNERFLIFGFTYMVWQSLFLELAKTGERIDAGNGILFHGGGWKKLQSQAVSREEFRRCLAGSCNLTDIHDHYGMAEQAGSIFVECAYGHLHASDYSEVLFRRAKDFSLCDVKEKGIIQVLSVLPRSYPGHSLLTEDAGTLLGVDDCPCGRKGAYFSVEGRLANAELRGCSDTYAAGIR